MNRELEALLLGAAKALDLGVVGVSVSRAQQWGVPVGLFVRQGEVIPGSQRRAKTTGYYCPYSAWRPPSKRCLTVDQVSHGDGTCHYRLALLYEENTGHGGFGASQSGFTLKGIKAYLRGIADGVFLAPRGRK